MLAGFALSYCGLFLLSLSITRHFKGVQPNAQALSKPKKLCLKLFGLLALLLALALASEVKGLALASVYFFAWLSLAALLQAMVLSYAPRLSLFSVAALIICTLFFHA